MTVAFDTSVGGPSATSYPTLSDASDYLTIRPGGSSWFSQDAYTQQYYLMYATKQLDLLCEYDGTVADTTQALRWPRVEAYDCDGIEQDSTSIPDEIKNATCELAFWYLSDDRLAVPEMLGQGFDSAKVGPLAVTVDRSLQFDRASENVAYALGCLGEIVRGGHGGISQPRAVRA